MADLVDGDLDAKAIVRSGYDRVSRLYRDDNDFPAPYAPWIAQLIAAIPPGGQVLDLGCGCGIPVARELARRSFDVTGIDISEVQISRARALVPEARFIVADASDVSFEPASFDAVCSLYALIHLPQDEQSVVIGRIGRWLKPGGLFLATVGHTAWTGRQDNWLGSEATMWWSHPDEVAYQVWIESAGLLIEEKIFIPDGTSGHTQFTATKSKTAH